ncbi:MAG: PLP-dependent aminotransferase family protein [Emergencia sp.]|jgi:GntR family transcriptional regulator of abcA and norABC|uniref:aminotransferase-like domain-containing protein n=1 Tax=Emergencia sp. 1XD21-10 TaxID=2304569 RepID=UPI00137A7044|nr:PLP-dependent aminotransferase family protein [Emergencia sp. 1XD21-10]MCI9476010.1 PLP-dependent aminotransferase family protein [Emergencia sp.]MCI9639024.1 PLP-dependent aminotransferase family protein [Emergencia sp.]NCE99176.1 PLP-dependent aminotransferase family protein [Emergencia sp. 1XD21-10]
MITLDWKPDKQNKTPIYRQIVKYISDKIAAGDWVIGSRLPSQRAMAKAFEVNRSTIVSAMEELISYGILESDFGGGTRVASNTWSLRMSQPPDWNKYIASGPFGANLSTIQTINKMEFEPGYIRIGTGELSPELYPGKLISKIFRRMPERIPNLGYLGTLGLPELGQALSAWLKESQGIDAKASNIMIASGSLQALQLVSVCMLKRGSDVYTEAPSYLKSLQIFQSAGMNLHGVPLDEEGLQYWNIKDASNESLLYTIPTFHNPTGTVMSEKRRKEVMAFCQKQPMPILEDDAYGQLWLDEKPPASLKSRDKTGSVIYMGTISKTMAPGLRIGWVVGPEAVVYRLGDVKMQTDYGASSVSQWMMTELITSGDYDIYLEQLRRELRARRDNALATLDKYFKDLATWNKPKGGFYIWLRFDKRLPMDKIFTEALKAGILLNPGNVYDYAENHAIRLSYAYADPDDLARALTVLAEIIEKHQKK